MSAVVYVKEIGRQTIVVRKDRNYGYEAECGICLWLHIGYQDLPEARRDVLAHAARHELKVVA